MLLQMDFPRILGFLFNKVEHAVPVILGSYLEQVESSGRQHPKSRHSCEMLAHEIKEMLIGRLHPGHGHAIQTCPSSPEVACGRA